MAHIIVIDDDRDIRLLVQSVLKRAGHRVEAARDGIEGMTLHRQEPADLIITDIIMPCMDGIEVIADLMRSRLKTRILAISGGGDWLGPQYVLKVAKGFNVHQTLSKPFSAETLLGKVDSVLAMPAT
nr:Response regulator receiver domain [uncultured bacterium]